MLIKLIAGLLLMAAHFILPLCRSAAFASAVKDEIIVIPDTSFRVKLPDGLYMFQPKITEEVFSPLFIVKNGSLLDPYAEVQKLGVKKFTESYAEGKSFNVYAGGALAGRLKHVTFESMTTCRFKELLPDIRAKGGYEGRPLFSEYSNPALFDYYKKRPAYGSIKAVLTPASLNKSGSKASFDVTDEDEARTLKDLRARLTDYLVNGIRERLDKNGAERTLTGEGKGGLYSLKAVDMNNDGKKDLIGIYDFRAEYRKISGGDKDSSETYNATLLFFMTADSDVVEPIYAEFGLEPAFNLGGAIDTDGDGFLELTVQEDAYFAGEKNQDIADFGSRIALWRRTALGWRKVYLTEKLCKPVNQ